MFLTLSPPRIAWAEKAYHMMIGVVPALLVSLRAVICDPGMREAARVTRSLTYPRRGLHGEVVHLIGLADHERRAASRATRFRPRTSSRPTSPSAARCCVRPSACWLRRDSSRLGRRSARACGPARTGTSSTPTSSAGGPRPRTTTRLYEETTEVRLAIEPLASRLAATRASESETAADCRGVRGDGGGRRRPGGVPGRRPALPRPHPLLVSQRAPRRTWASSSARCFGRRSS